jgi:hypothetical protein
VEQLLSLIVLVGVIYFILRSFFRRSKAEAESLAREQDRIAPPTTGFMRVMIERRTDRKGVSSSGRSTNQIYQDVILKMSFSQEALAIIKKYGLWSLPLYDVKLDFSQERGYRELDERGRAQLDEPVILTLKDFMETQPFVQAFDSPIEADLYEQRLKGEILPKIKQALESASASGQRKSESFEL